MIERSVREALLGAGPDSKQELNGRALLSMLKAAMASGFKDPAILRPLETTLVLPEGAIRLPDVQTVGMSNEEMERLADSTKGLNLGEWGRNIIKRAPTTSKEPLTLSPVVLDARTMGIRDEHPTTKKVWDKAKEFGDRVTAEEMLRIAIEAAKGSIQVEIGKPLVGIMEPVTDSIGRLFTLYVERRGGGLWLYATCADPDRRWSPDDRFVVSARK